MAHQCATPMLRLDRSRRAHANVGDGLDARAAPLISRHYDPEKFAPSASLRRRPGAARRAHAVEVNGGGSGEGHVLAPGGAHAVPPSTVKGPTFSSLQFPGQDEFFPSPC